MDGNRRRFLKLAGLSLLTLGAGPITDVIAQEAASEFKPPAMAKVGKRWAMVVDQKKCLKADERCKDCAAACHMVHNVPMFDNPKDEVKWIWPASFEEAFPGQSDRYMDEYIRTSLKNRKTLILCNHCDNPPCVRVCPVKATFRRDDGIVMMDYHRCIGCRYCMAACPYGARSFNWQDPRPFIKTGLNKDYPTRMKGVVEKCSFCDERLAKGLNPACVDACKEKALVFGDLEDPDSEIGRLLRSNPSIQRKPHLGTRPKVYYIL